MAAPEAPEFRDDASFESLAAAISQSKAYYGRLPAGAAIRYGELTYSPAEMIQSLAAFETLVRTVTDPAQFDRELARRFLVFESRAEGADNLFTGYYEPVIPGVLAPEGALTAPIYSRPADLVEVPLEQFGKDMPARRLMGRVENGRVVPYYSRGEITGGDRMRGVAQTIVYVDPVDLFFLQIQGSGRVRLPNGDLLRVGYDGSNGHPYRSLGAEMIRRELLKREEVTLHSIRGYLATHPDAVPDLLRSNPSYVFFRKLEGDQGPLGNLGVPLTPGRSLAADQRLVPPGGIAYVMTDMPVVDSTTAVEPLRRFMLVQDIGGAIRGHGRGDIFWGMGHEAEWRAGHAKFPGRMFYLVARKEFLLAPPVASSGSVTP